MAETEIIYEGDLRTLCIHGESGEKILTDAPKDNQGKGRYFSPTDLVGVALGSCVMTIMGIYAARQGLSLEGMKARVSKEMENRPSRRIKKLILHFTCPTKFDEETQKRLERIALECPVHASLHPDLIQEFSFSWGKTV
jgi:putative redox protein